MKIFLEKLWESSTVGFELSIRIILRSLTSPKLFPAKSVPETVTETNASSILGTVQLYTQTDGVSVAVSKTFETTPEKLIVGFEVISWQKKLQ